MILELVRQRRLLERYALLWLFSAVVLLALAVWRDFLETISETIGIATRPNALFVIAFGFVLVLLLHFSIAVSRLADQSKVLAQRVALLEERLKRAEAGEQDRGGRGGGEAMSAATKLEGPIVIEPAVHGDERGFFCETWRESQMAELGIHHPFVQDNHSRSARGVLRGMHFQVGEGQAKLVRCARGSILDVVVDLRRGSPTYGGWEAFALDDASMRQVYVPVGFAHGFCVTSEVADVVYRCSSYYDPELERSIRYDDPAVGIEWPDLELTVSERDAAAPLLARDRRRTPVRLDCAGVTGSAAGGPSAPQAPWNP